MQSYVSIDSHTPASDLIQRYFVHDAFELWQKPFNSHLSRFSNLKIRIRWKINKVQKFRTKRHFHICRQLWTVSTSTCLDLHLFQTCLRNKLVCQSLASKKICFLCWYIAKLQVSNFLNFDLKNYFTKSLKHFSDVHSLFASKNVINFYIFPYLCTFKLFRPILWCWKLYFSYYCI